MWSPMRLSAVCLLGVLVLQAAWILAVPPFRASDEFDHAYRAAGVARGEWVLRDSAIEGRGLLVDVPVDLVRAASDQCDSLSYTGHDNCFPARYNRDGSVSVATGAGPYHPAYYWVIGSVARPFTGAHALYAMRVASSALCALVLGLAGWVLVSSGAGLWARLGFVLSLTPVVLFSSAMAAPNGLEITGGVLLWTSCLAFVNRGLTSDSRRKYFAMAVVAVGLLGFLRLLGPVWLALIVLTAAMFAGRSRVVQLWAQNRRQIIVVASVGAVSVASNAWWITFANGTASSSGPSDGIRHFEWRFSGQLVAWILQMVAAFPYRDQLAPIGIYPLFFIVVVTALVVAIRRGSGGERTAISLAVGLSLAVPIALTLATIHSQGLVWQGRYEMPYVVGIMLMCGTVLDRVNWAAVEGRRLVYLAGTMLAGGHVVSIHHVMTSELSRSVSADDPMWVHPPVLVVDAMVLVGWSLLMLVVLQRRHAH